ncbi:EAP30/Vps36 family-domain-containing protein [Limtongia smithiae]|uniref:EAP30/Vps36 family-domain-containing protein n=1 Tax=Limtongia smithiae TaxID=1125753 RepID=UPI0034CE44D3
MRFWSLIDLTAAHRPVLFVDETDILVQNSVGLYEGLTRLQEYQNGRLYLTSHRICYVDIDSPLTKSVAINLPDVKSVEYAARFLKSSPKITVNFEDSSMQSSLYSASSSALNSSSSSSPNGSSASLPGTTGNNGGSLSSPSSIVGLLSLVTWICPICSFSNKLPSNYRIGLSPVPPCATCGVKPSEKLIDDALAANNASSAGVTDDSTSISSGLDTDDEIPCQKCTFLNNSAMRRCELCGAVLRNFNPADYILDKSAVRTDSYLPFSIRGANGSSSRWRYGGGSDVPTYVRISFRGGGDKEFFERLKAVITDRTWLKNMNRLKNLPFTVTASSKRDIPEPEPKEQPKIEVTPSFGIHGLQRLNIKEREQGQMLLGSIDDLQSLMKKAKDLIGLAESFATRLASSPGVPEEARRALRESSNALSLSSPIVTKEMAGGGNDEIYFAELARQLAEFLVGGVLESEGGIVPLLDLFALYNRARGISLVSPKDLRSACSYFEKLNLPFRVRQFKSGLLVIQETAKNDDVIANRLVQFVRDQQKKEFGEQDGVTAEDVSSNFGWSFGVCVEELQNAVEQGKLVSDAAIEGTRYFIDILATYAWDWKKDVFQEDISTGIDFAVVSTSEDLIDVGKDNGIMKQRSLVSVNRSESLL